MVTRLLPKSEITKRKAEEQHQALQEGLKVASRVDTLRETLASEETAFEKYRTDSLKAIQAEIQVKQEQKNILETELVTLRRERKDLLEPLDAKWEEVNHKEAIFLEREKEVNLKESGIESKMVQFSAREHDIKTKEEKAENLKKLASAMFSQAETMVASAKEDSADMRNKAHAELLLVELQKLEVEKKEDSVNRKESSVKESEQKLEKYEIDLAKREQILRAGWKNLEQTKSKLLP